MGSEEAQPGLPLMLLGNTYVHTSPGQQCPRAAVQNICHQYTSF